MFEQLFLSGGFDRATHLRDDDAWLARALAGSAARLVPVWRNRNLFAAGDRPAALFPEAGALPGPLGDPWFLGLGPSGVPYFACTLQADDDAQALAALGISARDARFAELRAPGVTVPAADFALLGYARALVYWNAKTAFCGVCGAPTRPESSGHVRLCTNEADGTRHFPRTDPASIMLVYDDDRCLLGRQATWQPGRFSALAGFVEPGESLEDAVIREVREESGIAVTDVRYFASQPWPFPQSLMLGFFAQALTTTIVRGDELEDVRWFTRDEVRELECSASLSLPGVETIARRLITMWLRDEHERVGT